MAKHTPPDEQRRLIAQWCALDISMADFARQHGIKPKTFGLWVARHDHSLPPPPPPTPPPAFLPVMLRPPPPAPAAGLSVQVAGHTLHFEAPPPATWFTAVVWELASIRCGIKKGPF